MGFQCLLFNLNRGELQAKAQEQRKLRLDFEKEIENLENKVEEVVSRKEHMIEDITEQHELAIQKIHQLEKLINQQSCNGLHQNKIKKPVSSKSIK